MAQDVCPGYSLSNVHKPDRGLTGSLSLSGSACNAYDKDYTNLTLTVLQRRHQQDLHLKRRALQPPWVALQVVPVWQLQLPP